MADQYTHNPNEVVSGLFGRVYDENGLEVQGTQEFEAKLTFDKKEVKIAGKMTTGHKIMSMKGEGKLKIDLVDGRLSRKIAENPFGKYNYIGKLADPTARGEEAVLLKGVSFNGVVLTGWTVGDLVQRDLDFTFDDFEYLDSIGG